MSKPEKGKVGERVRRHRKLGDILLEAGVISEEELHQALAKQKETQLKLGDQLVEMGIITEQQLIEVLEKQLGIPHVNLYQEAIDRSLLHLISEEMAKRYLVMPIRKDGNRLLIAMADPLDFYAIDDLRLSTGFVIEPLIARKEELSAAINRFYGMQHSIDQLVEEQLDIAGEQGEGGAEEESPAAQLVNQLLLQGISQKASDIHLDPQENETLIRLRVDGQLRTERTFPRSTHALVVARIKILSGLNIAEKRLPQDGRFQTVINSSKVDVRVSILPTVYGEKVVLRLLDLRQLIFRLDQLDFSQENLARFQRLVSRPYGLVLVTGPTGSGKTTTLYAALQSMNRPEVNIITVEDPVEYQITGINQVQINPTIGLTFASALRSILRQDPNVIMVGEIRDLETGEMALQAALTGHLVLSTLHTNDAVSAVTRLIDMGLKPYMVSAALTGVVAQRLVRRVCPHCAQTEPADDALQAMFIHRGFKISQVMKGAGCPECYHSGYRGRVAIQEVVEVDDQLRRLIVSLEGETVLREHVAKQGITFLMDDGLIKVAQGQTTMEEVYRAVLLNGGGEDHV